ncbi:hypothetical protein ABEB36_006619 [Hypothenemus hampei]|uniref:PPM-type phosphatase domain-containing protein n=1 Tax=Hypothenemus hampei TaxID=57062 RepID=A0ABD1ER57_HYPHA
MPASIGVNLRVTGNCRQGGRKYMEDCFSVAYQQTEDEKDLEYAFFGIYDGHGGVEAASFAKEHLMDTIIKHKNFWSDNDEDVLRAIKDGYIATHYAMWREQSKWPKTSSGLPSTAGTTASVAFIRRGKIYIGHVGDSGIILGYQEPGSTEWKAKPLTKDHKPENPEEMKRIEQCGGKVVSKSGVPRVVWNRPKIGHQGPVRRSTPIDEIPFLAVARSLGDLWSYNSQINQFVVSPDPDCSVLPIDTNVHRCLIFGTDGLFNMLTPLAAVHVVQQAERHNECEALSDDYNKVWLNPSRLLVERALERWHFTKMRADNTSAVTLMLDPPGPPRAQVLKDRKKNLPESGLKIMTRYDEHASQESSQLNDDIPKSPQTSEVPTELLDVVSQKDDKSWNKCGESATSCNTSVSSNDVSSNYPLKERNSVAKPRESTSFDSREPYRQSDNDKENTSNRSTDDSIQINEISSSNIEETLTEVEESNKKVEKKGAKRKLQQDQYQPRKSLRLSLNPKITEARKKPAPCTLAEEKLKKLAEEAEKMKLSNSADNVQTMIETNNNNCTKDDNALSITQKILRNKNMSMKKKIVKSKLSKRKLKRILENVVPRVSRNVVASKVASTRSRSLPEKETIKKDLKRLGRAAKKNKTIIAGKLTALKQRAEKKVKSKTTVKRKGVQDKCSNVSPMETTIKKTLRAPNRMDAKAMKQQQQGEAAKKILKQQQAKKRKSSKKHR